MFIQEMQCEMLTPVMLSLPKKKKYNARRDSALPCHLFILPVLSASPADVEEVLELFAALSVLNSSPRFLNSSGAMRFLGGGKKSTDLSFGGSPQ